MLIGVLVAAVAATAGTPPADPSTTTARSLYVVTLDGFRLGARRLFGRTPIQVTSAFGRPDARAARTLRGRVATVERILAQPYSPAARTGRLVSADYPRTITWGISASTRWLQLSTDLDLEYRG